MDLVGVEIEKPRLDDPELFYFYFYFSRGMGYLWQFILLIVKEMRDFTLDIGFWLEIGISDCSANGFNKMQGITRLVHQEED